MTTLTPPARQQQALRFALASALSLAFALGACSGSSGLGLAGEGREARVTGDSLIGLRMVATDGDHIGGEVGDVVTWHSHPLYRLEFRFGEAGQPPIVCKPGLLKCGVRRAMTLDRVEGEVITLKIVDNTAYYDVVAYPAQGKPIVVGGAGTDARPRIIHRMRAVDTE
jgi:hypothetical protein